MNKFSKKQVSKYPNNYPAFQYLVFKYFDFIICLVLVSWILGTLLTYPVYALDSTPSASVKEKLDALKLEIASKAAKLKTEVNKKLQNKAYTGIVKAKSTTSITLASKTGSRLVSVNQDTAYQDTNPKKKGVKSPPPSIQTIKEESNIAALGDVDDTGVLHARKVIILPPPADPKTKIYVWGQITSISDLVTVKTKEDGNVPVSMENVNTKFKISDFVIVTGLKNKNDILEASSLYLIQKTSTPSATPKIATPSGKKNK